MKVEEDKASRGCTTWARDSTSAGKRLPSSHARECPHFAAYDRDLEETGALFWVITNGNVRAGMPVWSKLPDPQRWQIASYARSLGAATSAPRGPDRAPGR
jgi:hypothetical protein